MSRRWIGNSSTATTEKKTRERVKWPAEFDFHAFPWNSFLTSSKNPLIQSPRKLGAANPKKEGDHAYVDAVLGEASLKVLHESILADGVQKNKVPNSGLAQIHNESLGRKKKRMKRMSEEENEEKWRRSRGERRRVGFFSFLRSPMTAYSTNMGFCVVEWDCRICQRVPGGWNGGQ